MLTEPADETTERAVLGACLTSSAALDTVAEKLDTADFRSPATRAIWESLLEVRKAGLANVATVTEHLNRIGKLDLVGGGHALARLALAGTETLTDLRKYVETLVKTTARRRIVEACRRAATAAAAGADPYAQAEVLRADLESIEHGAIDREPEGLVDVDELMELEEPERKPLIDGLLDEGWRVVVVGGEGVGKMVLLRAVAGYASAGLHPFRVGVHLQCGPVNTLIVDLENPDPAIQESMRVIRSNARKVLDWSPKRLQIWRRPEGIDIRQRGDLADLEAVIAKTEPKIVAIGPAYKLFSVRSGESSETAVVDAQKRLDALRKRYGFGLLLETHAPHGASAKSREMRPIDSSAWLRWPEIGLTLVPTNTDLTQTITAVNIGRFRRDRVPNSWPAAIQRRADYLWEATNSVIPQDPLDEDGYA